jgi:hypothetical protein
MKKMMFFLFCILVWVGFKVASNLSLIDFINYSFLFGIIVLLVGACFIIFQSGFLSLFFEGFRMIGSFAAPKSRAMARADKIIQKDEGWQSSKRKFTSLLAILALLVGFSSITVSLFGLFLY